MKKEDDCWSQLMILNSPVNIKYRDCSVYAYCRPISHNKFMFLPRVKLFPIHAHLKVLSLSQQTLTFDSQFNQLNIGVSLVYFFVARCVLNEKKEKYSSVSLKMLNYWPNRDWTQIEEAVIKHTGCPTSY